MASSYNDEFGSNNNLRISLLKKQEMEVTEILDRIIKLSDSLLVQIFSVLLTRGIHNLYSLKEVALCLTLY
ncbi:hypothetical protein RDI58_026786 [Solanum bulbocastanum]|uniref:Uncharacterized protein n=1 Tax=Solanum bulbocastanum TaxID=147425 RepID=A0AAN8SWF8_SOLBU